MGEYTDGLRVSEHLLELEYELARESMQKVANVTENMKQETCIFSEILCQKFFGPHQKCLITL